MPRYVIKSAFTAKTPIGSQIMKKGEAMCLSSFRATSLVSRGLIVEEHVGLNLLDRYEARVKVLLEKLGYSQEEAQAEAVQLISSLLKRHDALKTSKAPTPEFLEEVEEFNRNAAGENPITPVDAKTGVGEWASYRCNIGKGCSHGCLYCFAENMAVVRFKRVEADEWLTEIVLDRKTEKIKKYDTPIMFPTTHDITSIYLPAYRCHLYNILNAGNTVVLVSKPHWNSIESICRDFTSFRDNLTFRFTIGSLDSETLRHWEPGAPDFEERVSCLKHAFEMGYASSVSAEPMLGNKEEAERQYFLLEPYITEDIWFGKMKDIGKFRKNPEPEIVGKADELTENQTDDEIMELVGMLDGLPKVKWKDSVKAVIAKRNG